VESSIAPPLYPHRTEARVILITTAGDFWYE